MSLNITVITSLVAVLGVEEYLLHTYDLASYLTPVTCVDTEALFVSFTQWEKIFYWQYLLTS